VRSKNHHGTPFIAGRTTVDGPSSGPMEATAAGAAWALTASTTASCGPSSAADPAARTATVTIPSLVCTRSPPLCGPSWSRLCRCTAASVVPRASTDVSAASENASRLAMYPPTAPAPTMQMRMPAG
jgi:hypothetical protein